MNDFFSWEMLATFAGCTAGTSILTQFVKNVPFLKNVNNQIISYVFALLIMILTGIFGGTFSAEALSLDIVNAVVVSLAANGAYDAASKLLPAGKQE